jgi:hypothetical protein
MTSYLAFHEGLLDKPRVTLPIKGLEVKSAMDDVLTLAAAAMASLGISPAFISSVIKHPKIDMIVICQITPRLYDPRHFGISSGAGCHGRSQSKTRPRILPWVCAPSRLLSQ